MIPQFEDLPQIKGMKHFKLRAECFYDVIVFLNKLNKINKLHKVNFYKVWGIKIEQWDSLPDVEFEFKTRLSSDEIIAVLMKQVDSHVMMNTLLPIDEYTGESTDTYFPEAFGPQT